MTDGRADVPGAIVYAVGLNSKLYHARDGDMAILPLSGHGWLFPLLFCRLLIPYTSVSIVHVLLSSYCTVVRKHIASEAGNGLMMARGRVRYILTSLAEDYTLLYLYRTSSLRFGKK